MINGTAMREAVINAIVHNDYSNGATPKFEFFSDRLEITSAGGLPYGVSEEDFFNGYSSPRNKEIMRVFRDLEIVEHLGSGIPRILETYGRDAFEIRPNFLRVIFHYEQAFDKNPADRVVESGDGKTTQETTQAKILALLEARPATTRRAMAASIGISVDGIKYHLEKMKAAGVIRHTGSTKAGHWEVLRGDHE